MIAVILAGGYGSRLGHITNRIPKPLVKIGGKPILSHIIDIYIKNGINNFIIALGYKGNLIKKYYRNKYKKINIKFINTGQNTMTGGRIKRLKKHLSETFLLTYGDGLTDVNISKIISLHKKKKKIVTVCAVHPPARFGGLILKKNKVINFEEKNSINEGWINGGFFVMEPRIFNFIKNDKTVLEKTPLEKVYKINKMIAYKKNGFWR